MTLALIVDFGFSSYLLREIGAQPEKFSNIFCDGVRLKVVLIAPFFLAAFGSWLYFGFKLALPLFVPMLLAALCLSFSEYCIAPLRAFGRYDLETAVISASNFIHFTVAGFGAYIGGDTIVIAWLSVACRVQHLIVAILVVKRVAIAPMSVNSQHSLRNTFRKVAPYGADGVLSTCWNQIDLIIIGSMFGPAVLGVYAAGQKIVQGLYTFAQVIGNVMIPRLSRLFHQNHNGAQRGSFITVFVLVGIGGGLTLPLIAFSTEIVRLLFGNEYITLSEIAPYLGLILISRYFSAGTGIVLTAMGKQADRVCGNAIGLLVFVAGSWLASNLWSELTGVIVSYLVGTMTMAATFQWRVSFRMRAPKIYE